MSRAGTVSPPCSLAFGSFPEEGGLAPSTSANEIIDTSAEQGMLSGKSPTGYAAAAIYAASLLCNEKKTQNEVASVAQVTEVTIRNRYQEQIAAMGLHD